MDGSCLTDATCDNMVTLDKIFVFSTIHVALITRYITQAELVHRSPDRARPVDVLDVGCNNGAALRLYASRNFQTHNRRPINYVGLDLDDRAITKARANVPRGSAVASANFHHVDFTKPWDYLPDSTFDVIWYTEAIEHVPPERAPFTLEEALRVARPGAVMMISTPAPLEPGRLVWPESHDHEFTREELRAMIDSAGWTRVDEYGLNTNWTRGRSRLRSGYPDLFTQYEVLRRRLGGTVARMFTAALVPDICDDLVHICVKMSEST